MPLYEYYCPNCEHRFEKLVLELDPDMIQCEECGWAFAVRLISACNHKVTGDNARNSYGLKPKEKK